MAYGWCLVAAGVIDVYGKWATNYIWVYLSDGSGVASASHQGGDEAKPPIPKKMPPREAPKRPAKTKEHKQGASPDGEDAERQADGLGQPDAKGNRKPKGRGRGGKS